jgi:hypothetical protein
LTGPYVAVRGWQDLEDHAFMAHEQELIHASTLMVRLARVQKHTGKDKMRLALLAACSQPCSMKLSMRVLHRLVSVMLLHPQLSIIS